MVTLRAYPFLDLNKAFVRALSETRKSTRRTALSTDPNYNYYPMSHCEQQMYVLVCCATEEGGFRLKQTFGTPPSPHDRCVCGAS
jgi:hypothetical protein